MAAQQKLKGVTIAKLKDMTCWDVMRGRFLSQAAALNSSAPKSWSDAKNWSDVSE